MEFINHLASAKAFDPSQSTPLNELEMMTSPRIAFVFSGSGAQYAQMGHQFLGFPTFRASLDRARRHLHRQGCQWDLITEIMRPREQSQIDRPDIAQAASTSLQLALVDLLSSIGISPCAVVGNSSGEIAAAYAAGAISFYTALDISYHRGNVTANLVADKSHSRGAMLAVGASADLVEDFMLSTAKKHGQMNMACYNSPQCVTVAGDATAIDELKRNLDDAGYFNRLLRTNGAAYHSDNMKPAKRPYAEALTSVMPDKPTGRLNTRLFSAVTGTEVSSACQVSHPSYWMNNFFEPVQFERAFSALMAQDFSGQKVHMIVEVGPHSQMGAPVKQILERLPFPKNQAHYVSCLVRERQSGKVPAVAEKKPSLNFNPLPQTARSKVFACCRPGGWPIR